MKAIEVQLKEILEKYVKIGNFLRKTKYSDSGNRLEISKRGDSIQYYLVKVNKETKELTKSYIKAGDFDLAKKLAQISYEKKLLRMVEKRARQLKSLLKDFTQNEVDNIYYGLYPNRRALVSPIIPTFEQRVKEWMAIPFIPLDYPSSNPNQQTKRGDLVRSKSEKILADMLFDNGVSYKYDCPLELGSGNIVYPDFTMISPYTGEEVYWEHFGMMDRSEYAENAVIKLGKYLKNEIFIGNRLIVTFETSKKTFDSNLALIYINKYLKPLKI